MTTPNELQTLRNKIRNLQRMGAAKSAAKKQRELAALINEHIASCATAAEVTAEESWIIQTLFGIHGDEHDLEALLCDEYFELEHKR